MMIALAYPVETLDRQHRKDRVGSDDIGQLPARIASSTITYVG